MSKDERPIRSAFSGFGGELLGGVQGMANGRIDRAFGQGFDEAANLCVNLVAKTIADLVDKINEGELLTPDEQLLVGKLTVLKAEMERQLHAWEPPAE